jgi:GNAT superfamily N-acetyltransferase
VRRDDFSGRDDLVAMQGLCSRLWAPTSRFHPGQLSWNRYYAPVPGTRPGAGEAISIWRDDAGQVVGFGWAEAQDWLELQTDPARPEVAEQVVEWFEEWSDAPRQSVVLMCGDPMEPVFAEAGFLPETDGPFLEHLVLDLRRLAAAPTTPGYQLRHVGPEEAQARAACHEAAWSDIGPSPTTAEAYAALMHAPLYRLDLDWVAVDSDETLAAAALVWLDPVTGVGLVEPVGTVPGHRGQGLAGAVTLAALHRLREVGGRMALVTTRGDDEHPGPRRLYTSLGFRPTARTVTWTRSLD